MNRGQTVHHQFRGGGGRVPVRGERLRGAAWLKLIIYGLTPVVGIGAQEREMSDEYAYEILRHVYRWHMDDSMLPTNPAELESVEVWYREVEPELDPDDRSRYVQVVIPDFRLELSLKKADYAVPEMSARVVNDDFKVVGVQHYRELPYAEKDFSTRVFTMAEMFPYLYATRNDRDYPDDATLERLAAAARAEMARRGAEITDTESDAVIFVAPISPVCNDLWVYWMDGHRILCFSSDTDLRTPAYWDFSGVNVEIYDLDRDVVIFVAEKTGSNAYVEKDWVGRVLFNCIVLGKKIVVPAAERPVNRERREPAGDERTE